MVKPDKPYAPSVSKYSANSNTITWSESSGADGYEVYMKSGKKWKKLGTISKKNYVVKKLKSASKYQYRIRSYVNIGGRKLYSPYSGKCYGATKPGTTKIISVSKKSKTKGNYYTTYRAKIRWKKVKGASGYTVYYRYPGSSYQYSAGSTTKTSYNITASISDSTSKTRYFYVKPYVKTNGYYYYGSMSKSKKYKYR